MRIDFILWNEFVSIELDPAILIRHSGYFRRIVDEYSTLYRMDPSDPKLILEVLKEPILVPCSSISASDMESWALWLRKGLPASYPVSAPLLQFFEIDM